MSLASFPFEWKAMILIEVLLMLSVGVNSLGSGAKSYFEELALRAEFKSDQLNNLVSWNQRGIDWRKKKEKLIRT